MNTVLKLKPQTASVLRHLESGQSITDARARKLFGITRLSARIGELKEAGFPVQTDLIKVKTRQGKARVASYSLVMEGE